MANSDLWKTPDIVPKLQYSDLPRTVAWFERVFGFRERVEARLTWPGGGRTWIEIGDGLLSIATADGTQPVTTPGLILKAYVDDVDGHFSRAKAEGATIISEPEDGFWGGRIYRARDLEDHVWEISQRGRDLAADQWKLSPGLVRGVSK